MRKVQKLSSELTWERFVLDLELLLIEDPSSLAPIAVSLNQILLPEDSHDQCLRNINFMSYELMARCQDKNEDERVDELINYFFNEKGFSLSSIPALGWSDEDLLIKPALQNKCGAPLPTCLVFLHLANQLDLPIHLIHLKRHGVLKWVRGGRSCFLDLANGGCELSPEQVLNMLNQAKGKLKEEALEILPGKKVFLRYVEDLSLLFKKNKDLTRLMITLNTRLVIEPNNLELIAERALLRQRMGFVKEALQDLKRYFSFVDKEHAPLEIQMAFNQMEKVTSGGERDAMDFLH